MSPILVLCYHAVSPTWSAPLSVSQEELERQLALFRRCGWEPMTFSDALREHASGKRLAITFDDAFLSVLTLARPVLRSLNMPGTVFAPTSFMRERQPLLWPGVDQWTKTPDADELRSMSWDDLGELAADGWEIGSHTRTHPRLTLVGDETLADELTISREEINQAIGTTCRSIAYPYGDADRRVVAAAEAAGYEAGAGLSKRMPPQGVMWWPRLGVYRADHWMRFLARANPVSRRLRATALWPA